MIDFTGRTFNRLTVIERGDDCFNTYRTGPRVGLKKTVKTWKCKCVCGDVCVIRSTSLYNNHTKSCGCLKKEHVEYRKKARAKVMRMSHEEIKKFIEA